MDENESEVEADEAKDDEVDEVEVEIVEWPKR